jgi:hypothetical protein
MSAKRIHRKTERTPDQRRQLEEIRDRFQRERPGLQDLIASGDATEVVPQDEILADQRLQQVLHRVAQRNAVARTKDEP